MFSLKPLDLAFVLCACAFNLLIAAILLAQAQGEIGWVRGLGAAWLLLGVPLGAAFVRSLRGDRPAWTKWAQAVVLLYMLVELLLDFVFRCDFRSRAATHVPYVLLEYAALLGLLATAIRIHRGWGWVVGVCFWAVLGGVAFLYARGSPP
jgi:hypothetical protein